MRRCCFGFDCDSGSVRHCWSGIALSAFCFLVCFLLRLRCCFRCAVRAGSCRGQSFRLLGHSRSPCGESSFRLTHFRESSSLIKDQTCVCVIPGFGLLIATFSGLNCCVVWHHRCQLLSLVSFMYFRGSQLNPQLFGMPQATLAFVYLALPATIEFSYCEAASSSAACVPFLIGFPSAKSTKST